MASRHLPGMGDDLPSDPGRQQDEMRLTPVAAEAVLVGAGDLDAHNLKPLRSRLPSQLEPYERLRHMTLVPMLSRSSNQSVRNFAAQMKARGESVNAFRRRFLTDWNGTSVSQSLGKYRLASIDLIGRLRQRHIFEQANTRKTRLSNGDVLVTLSARLIRSDFGSILTVTATLEKEQSKKIVPFADNFGAARWPTCSIGCWKAPL